MRSTSIEEADKIFKMIKAVPIRVFNHRKDKYLSIFVELLKKEYGENFNRELIRYAKERRIIKKVIDQTPDRIGKKIKELLKGNEKISEEDE